MCNKLLDLHNLMSNDALRQSNAKIYTPSTAKFYRLARPLIISLIEELGPEFDKFLKDDKIIEFFNDYILNRRYRRMEFTKSRKAFTEKKSTNTRKRENDV